MEIVKNNTAVKFAALAIGLAMIFSVAAPQAQAQSIEDLTAQINSLLTTIASLQSQLASMTSGGGSTSSGAAVCPFAWTTNLSSGDQGPDVMALQKFLNSDPATQVAASGVGSAGSETDYFGGLTSGAVAAFQNMYAAQVLTPVGLSAGTGYFGPSTRAQMNALCTAATPPADDSSDDSADDSADDSSDDSATAGTGVTIGTAAQPANSVAPLSAARVPFTSFTLTAGSDGPVTIDNVTVERTGFADNDVFAGIVLLGPSGEQLGDAKNLNSNNQAKVGTKYVIPAGQTHQFTLAGNMPSTSGSNDGQIASLSLVSVNTSATVSGSLPVTGASHVINESLSIGSVEVSVGPTDRDSASLTEEVGTVNAILASLRLTNDSSDEDVRVMSVRFEQNGSASNEDFANVNLQIDGVTYQPVISGDYYRFDLGSGIVIAEGFNKEMTLRGDFPGGSGKNAQFDIDDDTDIYVVGETFGFGTIPTPDTTGAASDASEFTTGGSPFFSASKIEISAGRVTNISKSSDVPSQNIAENVPNQPLGGFEVEVKGEPVTIQTMTFRLGVISSAADWSDVTNVSLVDANGAVVAGPVDATVGGVVLFGDTVTLPVGMSVYALKGKVSTDFANDDTISASTTPSSDWTSPEGEDTGDAVTLPSATLTGNTMTIKSATISVSVAPDPSAQTIVSGVSQFTMANVQFNGTQSGEDVRFSTVALQYTDGGSDPTNCRLFDGNAQLTDDTVNPSGTGPDTYVLDQNLIVPKGTIKTVAVKCDVPGGSTGTFALGVNSGNAITGTGLDSGSTVTATVTTGGPTMTLAAAGTLTITLDSSSPSLTLASAGSNDVTLGVLNLRATNENIRVDKLALQLASTTASDSGDIGTINVYQGATLLGSATIEGTSATTTTVTLNQSTLTVPKDEDVEITIKANLSNISASAPGQAGALVGIDFDGNPLTSNNNRAIGEASGAEVTITGSDTSVAGVRLFNSFPTVAKVSTTGDIGNGTNRDLLRFSITADSADDVGIYGLAVTVATTTLEVANVNIFAFTDSGFSSVATGVQTDGALAASDQSPVSPSITLTFIAETQGGLTTALQIPSGQTRYFAVRGDVSGVDSGDSVTTTLLGDSGAYDAGNLGVGIASDVDGAGNFVWSGNSDGESATSTLDFANGYQVPGLPANGLDELRGG